MSKAYEHTPNWACTDEDGAPGLRFTSIRVSVYINCDGRGLNRDDMERICAKLKRIATGRSKTRTVSAIV